MIERRHCLRLELKSCDRIAISARRFGKDLDRYVTIEASVMRSVNLPHPTRPDRLEDFVEAEASAGREGHGCQLPVAGCQRFSGNRELGTGN